ncbi:MAG: aldehyde dehydrogenase, partial [Propionicimonas sp.]
MTIDQHLIEQVVAQVALKVASALSGPTMKEVTDGIFEDVDSAVAAAAKAQRSYLACTMADRKRFVQAIRDTMLVPEHVRYMAEQAVAQTGMGSVEDKVKKNEIVATQTPGVEDLITEAWSGDDGLTTLEFSPFGVIGAITPTTNPTETITCNGIGMLAAGNAIVFSPHPRAKDLSIWQVQVLNKALAAAGAPPNLICMVREPSIENTEALMAHPDVKLLVATGGPGIVRAVMSSGKKAIGAGAGNPPVVVDQSADLKKAAQDIIAGASFDNNLPCTSEKECIAVSSVADLLRFHMVKYGAYEIRDAALLERLQALVMDGKRPNTEWVGKSACSILKALGIEPPAGTKLIIAETPFEHLFVQSELMMPILPIVRAANIDEAIELAIKAEHGFRHTA